MHRTIERFAAIGTDLMYRMHAADVEDNDTDKATLIWIESRVTVVCTNAHVFYFPAPVQT